MRNIVSLNLKYYREEKNLSQTQLAELVGVDQSHICKLENGQTQGSISILNKIADCLGVPISQLLSKNEASSGELKDTSERRKAV